MRIKLLVVLKLLFLVLTVHLYPLRLGYANEFIATVKPYYYKILRIFDSSSEAGDSSETKINIRRDPDKLSRRQAGDWESYMRGENPDYMPMDILNSKQNKSDFYDQERAPLWPGGDYVFERDVYPREIESTPSLATDHWFNPAATTELSTLNYDCNQNCLRMYMKIGRVCGQRWIERRKELLTVDLFGAAWLSMSWLYGWWFTDRDRQDVWEFREFESICDLEYENCRNITHSPAWFPVHFGGCQRVGVEKYYNPSPIEKNTIYQNLTKVLGYNESEYTTELWDLFSQRP